MKQVEQIETIFEIKKHRIRYMLCFHWEWIKTFFWGTFKELEMFLFDERRVIDYKAQNAIVGSQLSLQQNGETHQASQQKYPLGTKVWWEMLAVGHHSGDEAAEFF